MATKTSKKITDRMKIEHQAQQMASILGCEYTSKKKVVVLSGRRFSFNDAGEIVKIQNIVKTRDGVKYVTVSEDATYKAEKGSEQ